LQRTTEADSDSDFTPGVYVPEPKVKNRRKKERDSISELGPSRKKRRTDVLDANNAGSKTRTNADAKRKGKKSESSHLCMETVVDADNLLE